MIKTRISNTDWQHDKEVELAAKSFNGAQLEVMLVDEMMRNKKLEVEDCIYLCEHIKAVESTLAKCRENIHQRTVRPT
jgi:hypothetical protein